MEFSTRVFLDHIAQTSDSPMLLQISHASGSYLYAPDGKRYLDLISGIAVSNLGHGHPRIIEAIKKQADAHMHVMAYGEFVQSSSNQLAKKLTDLLPPNLNCIYFTNSGTEATEGAIKLARRVTGRTELVSFRGAYHGSTMGALSVSGNEVKKYAFRPLIPDVRFLRYNVMEDLSQITSNTAGVIIETIQGDAGVRIPDKEYLEQLRRRCDETGALLIFDEIQTGIGRTGKMFAFEHYGVVPDILTLAKALGGGMPLGAFISSKDHMAQLTHNPMLGHITTFGGNPVSCAAALAVLETIEDEKLLDEVEEKGAYMESKLSHPRIKEIRRKGLMFAVEFDSEEEVYQMVQLGLERGIICFWFLSTPNSFRLAPPLNISKAEMDIACETILECATQVTLNN